MIELADIIAPIAPPPPPPPYAWIAVGIALVILVLFFVLRSWLKRTRARRWAHAALKRTERDLQHGKLDARTAAFHIARALRDVYINKRTQQSTSLSPLQGEGWGGGEEASPPLPTLSPQGRGEDSLSMEAWAKFNQALDRARFSPHPIEAQQAAQLLAQAHQWIGRAS